MLFMLSVLVGVWTVVVLMLPGTNSDSHLLWHMLDHLGPVSVAEGSSA